MPFVSSEDIGESTSSHTGISVIFPAESITVHETIISPLPCMLSTHLIFMISVQKPFIALKKILNCFLCVWEQ